MCLNFIRADYERQVFEKLFHGRFIYTQSLTSNLKDIFLRNFVMAGLFTPYIELIANEVPEKNILRNPKTMRSLQID